MEREIPCENLEEWEVLCDTRVVTCPKCGWTTAVTRAESRTAYRYGWVWISCRGCYWTLAACAPGTIARVVPAMEKDAAAGAKRRCRPFPCIR